MKVTRRPELETKDKPFVYSYKCECGIDVTLYTTERPQRLIRCWECLKKEGL